MIYAEKLKYLLDNHFGEMSNIRSQVEEELSSKQSMFCVCGRLATGLHERGCKKFKDAITKESVKRLSNLLPAN